MTIRFEGKENSESTFYTFCKNHQDADTKEPQTINLVPSGMLATREYALSVAEQHDRTTKGTHDVVVAAQYHPTRISDYFAETGKRRTDIYIQDKGTFNF